jgi:ADP-heptose:LPS heptosyltransferase
MATPALKLLSDSLGSEQVGFLALKPSIAAMADASRLFGRVFAWDPDHEGLGKGLAMLRRLRGMGYAHSLALFPSSHWKFTAFHFLAGARKRWGFAYPNQRAPQRAQHRSVALEPVHDVFQNLRLVREFLDLAIEKDAGEPFFPLPVANPAGLPSAPYFACHPGSSAERGMAEKRLPPETFANWIRDIHRETGWTCILAGGPEEKPLRESLASQCPEAITGSQAQSLSETAGILRGARFFLGNDSGLMHLAAALGTRCAAVFGPTDEKRTGPFGYWQKTGDAPRHLILRRADLECSPCWTLRTVGKNPPCIYGDTRCLRDLKPEGLWENLREWVAHLDTPAGT